MVGLTAVGLPLQFYSEELTIEHKLRDSLKELGVKLRMFDQVPLSE